MNAAPKKVGKFLYFFDLSFARTKWRDAYAR